MSTVSRIEQHSCDSVPSFVRKVCEIRTRWTNRHGEFFDPWFRGQTRASWPLRPSLYVREMAEDEADIRMEFRRRALQLIPGHIPTDEWQWYFLMQHHGAPTRLLDWTDSALIALFFAVNSNAVGDTVVNADAAVWMLDPWKLNDVVLADGRVYDTSWEKAAPYLPTLPETDIEPRLPIAVDPPHFTNRVAVQRSHFTVFGSRKDGLELAARVRPRILARIRIERAAIPEIRLDLTTCGIRDTAVFPDLEGLSRELVRFYYEGWF
jgi:hypothetical protein